MSKINFFSLERTSATFLGYKDIFEHIPNVSINSSDFEKFDIILLTGFEADCIFFAEKFHKIRRETKIGIVDPKNISVLKYLPRVDFIVVDSLEMELEFSKFNKPILRVSEFPKIQQEKSLAELKFGRKIIIAYHGNRQHIISMYPEITSALEMLAAQYEVELRLIYNVRSLGKVPNIFPDTITVKHIQWTPNVYSSLADCHFGIVPNLMPIQKKSYRKISVSRFFLEKEDDYILRFKMLSNPGRLLVFWQLGIPVVADITPSNIELVQHGKNSYLAYDRYSYLKAFLSLSCEDTNKACRSKLQSDYSLFDHYEQAKRFSEELSNLSTVEQNMGRLPDRVDLKKYLIFRYIYIYELFRKISKKVGFVK